MGNELNKIIIVNYFLDSRNTGKMLYLMNEKYSDLMEDKSLGRKMEILNTWTAVGRAGTQILLMERKCWKLEALLQEDKTQENENRSYIPQSLITNTLANKYETFRPLASRLKYCALSKPFLFYSFCLDHSPCVRAPCPWLVNSF